MNCRRPSTSEASGPIRRRRRYRIFRLTEIQVDGAGFITVGDYCQTNVPGIYAIRDVIRTPLLAHVASKEGEIAVQHMADLTDEPRIDPLAIPAATYSEPQVASFEYTERQLTEKKIPYKKAIFPYRGSGKAVAMEESEGLVKVLLEWVDQATESIMPGRICSSFPVFQAKHQGSIQQSLYSRPIVSLNNDARQIDE